MKDQRLTIPFTELLRSHVPALWQPAQLPRELMADITHAERLWERHTKTLSGNARHTSSIKYVFFFWTS